MKLLYARMLRYEGIASVVRRIRERVEETARRKSFIPIEWESLSEFAATPPPVLNYLASAPAARLGGVPIQLIARLEAEAHDRTVALLYPIGRRYRLELESRKRRRAIEFERVETSSPSLVDHAFEKVVSEVARRLGTTSVHFEGAAGVPFGSVANLEQSGLRVVLSLHDFALFCARPHLLEHPQLRFCNYCVDLARCRRCLGSSSIPGADSQAAHRQAAQRLLSGATALVYPSEFLQKQHHELFSTVTFHKEALIEPAAKVVPILKAPALKVQPVRHLAIVGSITAPKGSALMEAVVAQTSRIMPDRFRWSVFGGGDPAVLRRLRSSGVTVHGYYRAGSLPRLLDSYQVDLALLLSIVPESFSLTLSECWVAGVGVVAFDHGAIAERIRRYGGGVLVKLHEGSAGVGEMVASLGRTRVSIPSLTEKLVLPTPRAAAGAYRHLYQELALLDRG